MIRLPGELFCLVCKLAMDAIKVLTWFDDQGLMRPTKFIWEGVTYTIGSTGRRWEDQAGLHILVMDHSTRVYELVFKPGEMRWYLNKTVILNNKALSS